MKQLLFIGNSHLPALKSGWEAKSRAGYQAEFFGVPQRAYQRMTILPDNSFGLPPGDGTQRKVIEAANGKTAVSLAVSLTGRDVTILVGDFSASDQIAALLADCDVADLRETGAATLLSDQMFAQACVTFALTQLPETVWHHRQDTKVVMIPRPATCDTCLDTANPAYLPWHKLAKTPIGATVAFTIFDEALSRLLSELGITYLPQPTETRTASGTTAKKFLADGGGVVPGDKNKRGDHAHMNFAYGALCATQLAALLKTQA
jgi:hypothetical protein